MKWLIWKEYRLNRLILIVGAVLLVAPHAVALVLALRGVGPAMGGGLSRLSGNLMISGIYSLLLSQLTLALLGGHAIACERADRSAEFLAYLPVARTRILAAKIVLALATMALVWIPNLLIVQRAIAGLPEQGDDFYFAMWTTLGALVITGLTSFCVAWLLSSFLESPTLSICGGLATPWLVLMACGFLGWWFDYFERDVFVLGYSGTCLVLALGGFAAGTRYYLRRVEP